MRALLHPVALVALAIWLLNDHLFKWWWPGLVTGKLSDITGAIVTPLVLIALVELACPIAWRCSPRFRAVPWACALLVAALFAATKTWLPANALYCEVAALSRVPLRVVLSFVHGITWTERVVLVPDPTDLVAAPFAVIAVWIARRCEDPVAADSIGAEGTRRWHSTGS